jgi:hypothetical protein
MRRRGEHERRDHGDGGAHDGIGGAERDAEFHGDGEQRQRGEGRDVGSGLRDGEWMRIVVGDDERFGNGDCVHGACGGAESGDRDADGDVGERWDEVGFGGDHDWRGNGGRRRDDLAEGDRIGAESGAGVDGDGGERCWRRGRDVDGEQRYVQRAGGDDGDICGAEFAGQRNHNHGDEQSGSDEECDDDDRGDGSGGCDDISQRRVSRWSEQPGIFAEYIERGAGDVWEIIFVHGGRSGVCAAALGAEREYWRWNA